MGNDQLVGEGTTTILPDQPPRVKPNPFRPSTEPDKPFRAKAEISGDWLRVILSEGDYPKGSGSICSFFLADLRNGPQVNSHHGDEIQASLTDDVLHLEIRRFREPTHTVTINLRPESTSQ